MRRLAYGPHPEQHADLRLPDGPPPAGGHPVAVVVHGGFWRARYGLEEGQAQAEDLAARGWASLNVEYRRIDLDGGWPETGEDVLAGIDALAEVDGLDLTRVAVIGHSAGGQLALWAATARDGRRVPVSHAVSLGGVVDLDEAWARRLGDGVVRTFLGGTPEEVPDAYAAASPRRRLPLGVPALLLHGGADDVVPADLSTDLAAAARAGGDDVDLVVRDGDDHFVVVDPAGAAWAAVLGWLRDRGVAP